MINKETALTTLEHVRKCLNELAYRELGSDELLSLAKSMEKLKSSVCGDSDAWRQVKDI